MSKLIQTYIKRPPTNISSIIEYNITIKIGQVDVFEQYERVKIRITNNTSKKICLTGDKYKKNIYLKNSKKTIYSSLNSEFDNEEILIFKEINKLKPIYRDIIYLYYYQGYKIKEISIILKMKENTVSSNLTRAREKLKTILEDGGVINVK